jgi:hypothetical protein
MATEQAKGLHVRASTPIPGEGVAATLLDSTALTTSPNGGVSSIVSVEGYRYVTLWITGSADAASAYPHIIPLVSGAGPLPLLGDDSWYGLAERDTSATATLLVGTLPTGADYTIAPEWAVVTTRPLVIRLEASDANTDEIRMCVTLNVAHARWMYIACEEITDNITLSVKYSLSN